MKVKRALTAEGGGPWKHSKQLLLGLGIPENCTKFQHYWLEGRKAAGGDSLGSYLVLFNLFLFLLSRKL